MGVLNNSVKGKIEITKEERGAGRLPKRRKDGHTILTPVFEKVAKLKTQSLASLQPSMKT